MRVMQVDQALDSFGGDLRATAGKISSWHSDAWTTLAAELAAGKSQMFHTKGESAGLFEANENPSEGDITIAKLPRIGLYSPWSGSMDEGWMRWVLDTEKIPYVTVRNEMLRAGNLGVFLDCLVIPSISPGTLDRGRALGTVPDPFAGGLAPEGAVAVEEFVRAGGTLITYSAASKWAIDLFRAPLIDTTAEPSNKEFSCPGSVLRALPEAQPMTAGLPASVPLFFSRGQAYRIMTDDERKKFAAADVKPQFMLRYAPTQLLQSGWIAKADAIENQGAWVRIGHGKGAVHIFGFQPHYRAWSQGTFQLVYRAAFLEPH